MMMVDTDVKIKCDDNYDNIFVFQILLLGKKILKMKQKPPVSSQRAILTAQSAIVQVFIKKR